MNIIKKIKLFGKKKLIIIGIILILTIFYIIIENTVDKNFDNIITNENEESDEIEINEKSNDNTEVKDDNNKITSEIDVDIEEDNEKVVEDKEEKIYVYITGEVNNPGVKELKNGSRIVEITTAYMIQKSNYIFKRNPLISGNFKPFLNFKWFREGYFSYTPKANNNN